MNAMRYRPITRFPWLLARCGVAVVCFLGCEETALPPGVKMPVASARLDSGFIAFVGAGKNDPLWPILKTGAEHYVAMVGTTEVKYFCPKGDSAQDQIELLQSLHDPNMQGMCIHMADIDDISPVLDQ